MFIQQGCWYNPRGYVYMLATWCLWHGGLEQWVSNMKEAGGHLVWPPTETSAWGLPFGQGCLSPSPLAQGDILFLQLRVEPPRATNGSSLLGILCWETGWRLWGKSIAAIPRPPGVAGWWPWQCHGGSKVLAGEGSSTSVVVGAWVVVVMPSGCMLLKSTAINWGSLAGLPGVAAFQRGSYRKVNCKASSSPSKPSRHTTMLLCCNSLHICNWWSQPWVSTQGAPCIMVLVCPSLDRGTWDRASFSWTKAYA